MKILAVLYPGEDYAGNPKVLGCAENALSLGDSLEILSRANRYATTT